MQFNVKEQLSCSDHALLKWCRVDTSPNDFFNGVSALLLMYQYFKYYRTPLLVDSLHRRRMIDKKSCIKQSRVREEGAN